MVLFLSKKKKVLTKALVNKINTDILFFIFPLSKFAASDFMHKTMTTVFTCFSNN